MGRQIILKPDGCVAIWSSIVDDFIFEGSIEEYIEISISEHAENLRESIAHNYDRLVDGKILLARDMTYEKACKIRDSKNQEKEKP